MKNTTKKILFVCISIILALPTLYALFLCFVSVRPDFMLKSVNVTDNSILIENSYPSPSNAFQEQSNIIMGTSNSKLYFCINEIENEFDRTTYYKYLSVFDKGNVAKLKKADWFLGIHNGFLYYLTSQRAEEKQLMCYELDTGNEAHIITVKGNAETKYFFKDGILYVPVDYDCADYYQIKDGSLHGTEPAKEIYYLNETGYYIDDYKLVTTQLDANENRIDDISIGLKSALIPCDYGLLVHNSMGKGNILYLIREDTGEIAELLTVPCAGSRSAVAIYRDQVYVSFMRYERAGDFGLEPYESDSMSGTFSISLVDNTVEKISDVFYSGLYIFDDTGIYACDDQCNIYKLDYGGNIIMTLMK